MNNMLRLSSVSKAFGNVRAVDSVSIEASAGSRVAIVGPSGSGKTTLLRLIAGFDSLDSGSIELGDTRLATASSETPAHRRDIGIVSQDGALFPHLSIAENIGFGMPRAAPDRKREIARLLEMVGLDQCLLERRPDEISGGQQQRVALARALARRPRLMLLDEPFSALDTGLRASTRRVVSDLLSASGITTILVTHDQGEALSFADQVAVMHEGRLLQAGDPRDLYYRPTTPFIAEFLGDALILDAVCQGGIAICRFGRIPLGDARTIGPAKILLRPEQIVFRSPPVGENARLYQVQAVEFGGASSMVTLRDPRPEAVREPPVILQRNGIDGVRVGDFVALSVVGTAHAFPNGV